MICLLWDVFNWLQVFDRFANIEFEIFKCKFKLSLAVAAVNFWALEAGNFFKYVNLRVKHLLPLSVDFSEFICLLPEDLGDYFDSLTESALKLSLGFLRFLDNIFNQIVLRSFEFDVRVYCMHKVLN